MSQKCKATIEEQSKKFSETARSLGCDEDEAAFEDHLRQIARHKPKPADEAEAKDEKAPE